MAGWCFFFGRRELLSPAGNADFWRSGVTPPPRRRRDARDSEGAEPEEEEDAGELAHVLDVTGASRRPGCEEGHAAGRRGLGTTTPPPPLACVWPAQRQPLGPRPRGPVESVTLSIRESALGRGGRGLSELPRLAETNSTAGRHRLLTCHQRRDHSARASVCDYSATLGCTGRKSAAEQAPARGSNEESSMVNASRGDARRDPADAAESRYPPSIHPAKSGWLGALGKLAWIT